MCTFGTMDRGKANERIMAHLATWIEEQDFSWMQSQAINTIRLPIGYWNVIDDVYGIYFPINKDLSQKYIDVAFDWAEKYGMSVLIDLHGAPGSQNGQDHSGCGSGVVGWNTDVNRNLTIDAMESIAKRYGSRPNLFGIELMNEPSYDLEQYSHDDLLNYYSAAYNVIRKYTDKTIVINVLYPDFYSIWDMEFQDSTYYGIVVDYHMYDCFGGAESADVTVEMHIADAESWGYVIRDHFSYHPIFVGEYSFETGANQAGQPFIDAEQTSFTNGTGWFFWSLKLAANKDTPTWSFQTAIKLGFVL